MRTPQLLLVLSLTAGSALAANPAAAEPKGEAKTPAGPTNVSGTRLAACSTDPMTGFFRNGRCVTGPEDRGTHVVCATMTERFLAFTKARGNDLSSPAPRYRFPGLKPGDRWCLCALRYKEALAGGAAPPVHLDATDQAALRYLPLDVLKAHAR